MCFLHSQPINFFRGASLKDTIMTSELNSDQNVKYNNILNNDQKQYFEAFG